MNYKIIEPKPGEPVVYRVYRRKLPGRKHSRLLAECLSRETAERLKEGFEWAERRAKHYANRLDLGKDFNP